MIHPPDLPLAETLLRSAPIPADAPMRALATRFGVGAARLGAVLEGLVTEGMLGSLMRPGADNPTRQLTSRQREVLQLLAEGKSMKEVAGILNVTPRTVAFHKYRMMEQLRIKTNAELIQYALRNHVV